MSQHTTLENSQRDERSVKAVITTGKTVCIEVLARMEPSCTVQQATAAVIFTLQLKCDQL